MSKQHSVTGTILGMGTTLVTGTTLVNVQLYVYPKILIAVLSSYITVFFSRLSITMVMVGQV